MHKLGTVKCKLKKILLSGAGVQPRTLGLQGKNLQDRAAEVVDVADGLANSGRQEDEVRGRQAGADNLLACRLENSVFGEIGSKMVAGKKKGSRSKSVTP